MNDVLIIGSRVLKLVDYRNNRCIFPDRGEVLFRYNSFEEASNELIRIITKHVFPEYCGIHILYLGNKYFLNISKEGYKVLEGIK